MHKGKIFTLHWETLLFNCLYPISPLWAVSDLFKSTQQCSMLDLCVLISQTSDILVLEVYFTRNKRKETNGYSISSIYTTLLCYFSHSKHNMNVFA